MDNQNPGRDDKAFIKQGWIIAGLLLVCLALIILLHLPVWLRELWEIGIGFQMGLLLCTQWHSSER